MTDKDGWITHKPGDPCPVEPDTVTERDYGDETFVSRSAPGRWPDVRRYRIYVPAHTATPPGPSDFVAQTAARIMAGFAAHPNYMADSHADWAVEAVNAAQALEAALKEAGQ